MSSKRSSTVEPGVIMLPSCDLLQYWITMEKKRPLNTSAETNSTIFEYSIVTVPFEYHST